MNNCLASQWEDGWLQPCFFLSLAISHQLPMPSPRWRRRTPLLLRHQYEHLTLPLLTVHSQVYQGKHTNNTEKWWRMNRQKDLIVNIALRNGSFTFILESPPGCSKWWGSTVPQYLGIFSGMWRHYTTQTQDCFPTRSKIWLLVSQSGPHLMYTDWWTVFLSIGMWSVSFHPLLSGHF